MQCPSIRTEDIVRPTHIMEGFFPGLFAWSVFGRLNSSQAVPVSGYNWVQPRGCTVEDRKLYITGFHMASAHIKTAFILL